MTQQTLLVAVVVGAALIALWLYVRLGFYAPTSILRTFGHAACAYLLLDRMPALERLIAGGGESLLVRKFGAVFLVVLPGFTYLWLVSIWLIKLAQRDPHRIR